MAPARIILSVGQRGDASQVAALIGKDRPAAMLGDTACDADHSRDAIAKAGGLAAQVTSRIDKGEAWPPFGCLTESRAGSARCELAADARSARTSSPGPWA